MSYDLHRGMGDMAGDPITNRDLPLAQVLGRLRHARRVRAARYSVAGVAAVAAVTLAIMASGAARTHDPVLPVVTPSPSPSSAPTVSPTPTLTPTPVVTPAPVLSPPATPTSVPVSPAVWDPSHVCGTTVDLRSGTVPEYVMWSYGYALMQASSDPNAEFRVAVTVLPFGRSEPVARARIVNVAAATGEGVTLTIRGLPTSAPRPVAPLAADPDGFPAAADVRLASCDGTPLKDGVGEAYRLILTVEVTTTSGRVVTVVASTGLHIGDLTLDRPWPTAEKTGDMIAEMTTSQQLLAGLPTCGATYDRGPVPGAGLTLAGRAQLVGDRVGVTVTLSNTGLTIADGVFLGPTVTVTRNGVVVGQNQNLPKTPLALIGWAPGQTLESQGALIDSACDPMDAALPAGDYDVWVMYTVWDGPSRIAPPQFFYGGPWPVTVP
jgi:hypothetical protein